MSANNRKAIELIQNSNLNDDDKKEFTSFIQNMPDQDLLELTTTFEKQLEELVTFWTILKTKMSLINMIQDNSDFSTKEKSKIINQITSMSDEELVIFIDSMMQTYNSDAPADTVQKLLEAQKVAHEEFMTESTKLLSKLHHTHKKLQKTEDTENYEEVMDKINSL